MDSLYSAFIIEPNNLPLETWSVFTYSRSQQVSCSLQTATSAHTNLARSGWSGLPMEQEFFIRSWRASTNIRFAESVLDWASEVETEFRYNDKIIRRTPLLDILMASQQFFDESITGFQMRENITFEVKLQTPRARTEKLQAWLVEHCNDGKLICWIWLDGRSLVSIQ